jgi:cytochrome c2
MILVTALAATTLSAYAQDGDIAAGHSFAREACSACHVVDTEHSAYRGAFLSDRVSAASPTDPA